MSLSLELEINVKATIDAIGDSGLIILKANLVGGVRKSMKNCLVQNLTCDKTSYAEKFKIPLPKPPQGGPNACPYAILSTSNQNCRRSLQKYDKSLSPIFDTR